MKNLLIFVIFGLICSVSAVFSPYIIDGEGVGPTDIPFAVGIMLHRPQNPGFCGGTLVSRNYVLTAASCLVNVPRASVLLGASNINNASDIIDAAELIPHPLYDSGADRNDIGLIKLVRPADLSDFVKVIDLPKWSQRKKSFSDVPVTTFGWGSRGKRGEKVPVETLHAVKETVIKNLSCKTKYPAYITSSNICTGSSGTPCTGDEGGAMYMIDEGKPVAIGVFSYQFSMGCTWGWPPVYARITSYLEWIQSNSDVVIRD
ncbi:chymotrypsin-2-like [Culicoides brevitarsis]|uniref:chymotrypsin-2-like n=1 Tax=Culicoides brevitarsis TaxID=469753 RepID=UPI00307CB282